MNLGGSFIMYIVFPLTILFSIGLFYILQKRELKRFYEQEEAVKKEQQMTHILDNQSDSIVVIRKPEDC